MRLAAIGLALFLLLRPGATTASAADPWIVYGIGSLDPASAPGGFVAVALPSGRQIGQAGIGRQGGGFAISPDGRRAYLLDGDDFRELATPSLRVLRDVTLPDAIPPLSFVRVVAVARDGRQVYAETMRIVGPNRWDPRLRIGHSEADYGIAVYDVARGAFARAIPLSPPWCGIADLLALPDGRLAVFCSESDDLRLVDPARGAQVAQVSLGTLPRAGNYGGSPLGAMVSPDRRTLFAVDSAGTAIALDLVTLAVERTGELSDGSGSQALPYDQSCPCLVANGSRLVVGAAPGDLDSLSTGRATEVWIGDAATLRRVGVLRLPLRAFDLAPSPDGRTVLASAVDEGAGPGTGTALVDVASGQVLAHWPGRLTGMQMRAAARTDPAGPLDEARATLARFMDARIDRQDVIWLDLLTDRFWALPPAQQGPTGQISNPCWYRYEVLSFASGPSGSIAATVRIFQHWWPGDVVDGPPASWLQDVRLVWTSAGWRVDDLGPMRDFRSEPGEPHGPHTSACSVGRRPGVWLTERGHLPVSGGIPRGGLALTLVGGLALVTSGLAVRRAGESHRP